MQMMKLRNAMFCGVVGAVFAAAGVFAADGNSTNVAVTSTPVYVPDMTHANEPLPDGVLAWNSQLQRTGNNLMATNIAAADQDTAEFSFSFTNITANPVTILNVSPGCHCTTAELPPTPWTIPAGGSGSFKARVDLNVTGHSGTLLKQVAVMTDKGTKELLLEIEFLPPVVVTLTDEQKAAGIAAAKIDRQAVFKGDCASCHVPKIEGKYGQTLYGAVCAICHDVQNRAAMVPDLHNLKTPTNDDFWRTWIAHGKAGSLMPAFATAEGGPLNDMQIATLASFLNSTIPSHVPPPQ